MRRLLDALHDARRRTLELVLDLNDEQWIGAPLTIANPLFWELAHVAWFQEKWILRHARGLPPIKPMADALYDSAKIPHGRRWYLAFPSREQTLAYMRDVLDRSAAVIEDGEHAYFTELAAFHEDMHGEAFAYTRQTRAYPEPALKKDLNREIGRSGESSLEDLPISRSPCESSSSSDVEVPGGRYVLGAAPDTKSFVFDNEKWGHPVDVATFRIARTPVTNAEYADFVDATGAKPPVYWQRRGGEWFVRRYDRWTPLSPYQPVMHVSWFEADAYCKWAKRRLPTEAEWELAASSHEKRRFPWGDGAPTDELANLHGRTSGPVDVGAHPSGDSVYGCRQMIGNVWEWTSSRFLPYPGFAIDPYAEYSAPWFESTHMVLRGGSWATPGRLLRNTWRNFYTPDRSDIFAGFRTCAVD